MSEAVAKKEEAAAEAKAEKEFQARSSSEIVKEAVEFVQASRSIMLDEVAKAALEANEQLNAAATERAESFTKVVKKVAKREINAAVMNMIATRRLFENPADFAAMAGAVREAVKDLLAGPETPHRAAGLIPPTPVAKDPSWSEALSPGLAEFLNLWWTAGPRSAILTGPSGCGKTHPVRQWALSKSIPVWMIQGGEGCATRREAVGGLTLGVKDGASVMEKSLGVAAAAAIQGGILLLDEYDKIDPFVLGQLNDLLDTGGLLLPWGEFVIPAPGFRVILTGNGLSDDAGSYVTHQTSSELPMRCWGKSVTWPKAQDEAKWLESMGCDKALATRIAKTSAALRAIGRRPSASLRTSSFVARAAPVMAWPLAWEASYLFQFQAQDREAFNNAIGT